MQAHSVKLADDGGTSWHGSASHPQALCCRAQAACKQGARSSQTLLMAGLMRPSFAKMHGWLGHHRCCSSGSSCRVRYAQPRHSSSLQVPHGCPALI